MTRLRLQIIRPSDYERMASEEADYLDTFERVKRHLHSLHTNGITGNPASLSASSAAAHFQTGRLDADAVKALVAAITGESKKANQAQRGSGVAPPSYDGTCDTCGESVPAAQFFEHKKSCWLELLRVAQLDAA